MSEDIKPILDYFMARALKPLEREIVQLKGNQRKHLEHIKELEIAVAKRDKEIEYLKSKSKKEDFAAMDGFSL